MTGRFAYARPWQVVVGDRDVTSLVNTITFSNVDPGGFEACAVSLVSPQAAPRANDRVTVRYGLEVAWDGRVNDPGNGNRRETEVESIQAVGYGAALKDNGARMIFRDIDLSQWGSASIQRRINVIASNLGLGEPTIKPDSTNGPVLDLTHTGPWVSTARLNVEAWYSPPGNNQIGSIYYAWKKSASVNSADVNYTWIVYAADTDVPGATDSSGNLLAAGPGSGTLTAAAGRYLGVVVFAYGGGGGGADNTDYSLMWTTLAVYGNHGLTKRGSEPDSGFYPTDIAGWALANFNSADESGVQIELGPVDTDAEAYIVPHCVYYTDVPHEQMVDDMVRKQLGWHWGVWEPAGLHSDTPRLFMTKPPEQATAHVSRRELGDDFDAPRVRLDQLYNFAEVLYTDLAGKQQRRAVSIDNPLLTQAGITYRSLTLNAGTSNADAAETFGRFALNLAAVAARGAGSATIPETVGTTSGRKPALLLRAGRDRLRITDLPDPGPLHETDTRRFDTFHVRRVETMVDQQGVPQTRVELGVGADLMEVLDARLSAALVNAG